MLRVTSGRTGGAPRLMLERTFIAEVEALSDAADYELPCAVESLDRLGRVRWRAHCSSAQGLLDLVRELGEERRMAARGARGSEHAS